MAEVRGELVSAMVDEFDHGCFFGDDERFAIAIIWVVREEHEVLTATSIRPNRLPFVDVGTQ